MRSVQAVSRLRRDITTVHGGYAQSKWVAEQLVICAREQASIYRLGLLTANSRSGHAPTRDWFTLFLRDLAAHSKGSDPAKADRLKVDITPVDYAARAMVWLALNAPPDIYHIANAQAVSLSELASAILGKSNLSQRSDAALLSSQRAANRSQFHRTLDLFKATDTRFSMLNTIRGLAGSGITFPGITPAYLRTCLKSL